MKSFAKRKHKQITLPTFVRQLPHSLRGYMQIIKWNTYNWIEMDNYNGSYFCYYKKWNLQIVLNGTE